MDKKAKIVKVLSKYIPQQAGAYLFLLFETYPVYFKIVPPRKSKLGDFRISANLKKPQITVNGDLNQYAFLVTTIHEFAHLKTWMEHKNNAKPHGSEWKRNFIELMHPLIEMGFFPKDIEVALMHSFTNMKATSCTDIQLNRALSNYDALKEDELFLEKLPNNAKFVLNNRTYLKKELRRTRFLCEDLKSNKQYLIHKLAKVERIKNE